MRIDRMLGITVMLLNKDRVSAREIAEKYEVSVRTIYRDIEAINMAGIPVVAHSGINGGFGIMKNFKLDRQLLTFQDMLSILSALKGINTTLEDRDLDTAIEKITNLVPREKTPELQQYLQHVSVDIQPWGYRERQKKYVKVIHNAIVDLKLIEFTYNNSKGEIVKRIVEPMTLLFKGYAWYLFAYCRLKNDYRLFRLSRIKNLELTDTTFKRKNVTYEEHSSSSFDRSSFIDLILKFDPSVKVRVEEFFEDESIELADDGYLIVKLSLPEDEWIYSTLLSFGECVEVLSPGHIREIIAEKAEKILAVYKHDIMLSHS